MEPISTTFDLMEATIDEIHAAFPYERLTRRNLVELYLERISAYDNSGPGLNAIRALQLRRTT